MFLLNLLANLWAAPAMLRSRTRSDSSQGTEVPRSFPIDQVPFPTGRAVATNLLEPKAPHPFRQANRKSGLRSIKLHNGDVIDLKYSWVGFFPRCLDFGQELINIQQLTWCPRSPFLKRWLYYFQEIIGMASSPPPTETLDMARLPGRGG